MSALKLPAVNCQYGAPMGRDSNLSERLQPIKMTLRRVYLDSGGYDNGGSYWGIGKPLYYACGDGATEIQDTYVRAWSRADAKANIRLQFPLARFYN